MSTASSQSRGLQRRIDSRQSHGRSVSSASTVRGRVVSVNDAYLAALSAAYLAYLLLPRPRRLQHIPAAAPPPRASSSMHDLMKDFSITSNSKSTRFPQGFMSELERSLTGVLMGKDGRKEYQDAAVKRTFAVFYTAFTEHSFRKRVEQDRRVEDLVLIFFSSATKELQKGQAADDDRWKLLVDRHVALFVRLIGATLRDHDWVRDRPELTARLATLEQKLLKHDQDLAADSQRAGGAGGTSVEVEVPRTYEAKDMPLVHAVGRIFGLTLTQMQSDIDKHRPVWTEKAALQDLKTYQNLLNLDSPLTLRSDDFDLEHAYEAWRQAEGPELSRMILAIMRSNPQLAGSSSAAGSARATTPATANGAAAASPLSTRPPPLPSKDPDRADADPAVDAGADEGKHPFVFIPPNPRAYYRIVLMHAVSHDLQHGADADADRGRVTFLSKQSTDLLNEIVLRWRIPTFSRLVLFLDVIREKFADQTIDLDTLDAAFDYVKEPPPPDQRRSSAADCSGSPFGDRSRWTLADFILNRQTLCALHDALLRDLYDRLVHCYEAKAPSIGPIMLVLENHVEADPLFSKSADDLRRFAEQLAKGLGQHAKDVYADFLATEIPVSQDEWEFYHVIQLGKAVIKLAERIQKRYRKKAEVMGVDPLAILLETILPSYEEDTRAIVQRIIDAAKSRDEEVNIQDGFELYKELANVRRIHTEALPGVPFAFDVEGLLADFVWRWIRMTSEKMVEWVDAAVKQDGFTVRSDEAEQVATDEERHSVSVIDIFRSFNQAIDQIAQLEWDDDLQYARFMTAMAKSIGAGLARYCELIEQRFSREMDRPSAEQALAASQSRQERWVQLARDAWNNREKMEPFHFLPESFVKLNNIEWATYQLDKLEKSINVDGCADVIQRHTSVKSQRQRRSSNFVFTIKIVEAEDLKPCDINGLSDPYVVLGDEYQKRLAKTRIIYANLNPRWDESVDITTQGPLNIIATVWDWDTLGDHDCVGRTSIKLDPSHFGDYLPREYWLDLDTQGRLLLRVSMEGERDDIQFHFGKAFRTLKRTEREMTRTITDKLSAYIQHCLSRNGLRSLLNKGISMSSVSSLFRGQRPGPAQAVPRPGEVAEALAPLFRYFDDNFAIMKQTLTETAMVMVMTRLWKEVLSTIEALLVPPMSDKPSGQKPLSQQELDIVFQWLQLLFDFFHAVDDETGASDGVPMDVLKSPKYHEIQSLNFFYFEETENLIRTSERMASATAARQQQQRSNRLSAPGALGAGPSFGGAAGLLGLPSTRRTKSIMLSRNLGTMRKAKEEKRREAQADPSDDMILRILRMRPEAAGYLRDRSRQKERLAAAAAAELIVRQSMTAGVGGGAGGGGGGGGIKKPSTLPRR